MDKLENDYDNYDDYDDDVRDPDNEGDKESDVDMYESDEEEEGVNLDVVRRQEQPREEIRVYMDPPIERADGDTDKHLGEKKNKKILRQCCGSRTPDLDPDFFTYPDPGSSTLLVTILWKKVEQIFKKYCSVVDPNPGSGPDFLPILDPRSQKSTESWICNTVSDNILEKKLYKSLFFLTIFFLLQMTLTSQLA